ncbi:26S proteasome regulatory subunit N8 [Enteropsectra breve]|nr:26S proteasome regulatory subunit N8 [Enteropsectra breve]
MSTSCKKIKITPLVLLAVVDHYKRLTSPRVIGVLLGANDGDTVRVTNSFAIPFEESEEGIFLDSSYLKNMYELYCKVNAQEKIVGWYHSGPSSYKNDTEITKAFLKYCPNPILSIINVHNDASGHPWLSFVLNAQQELEYVSAEGNADDAEEVGVEFLLRDIKECTGCSIRDKINSIKESLLLFSGSLDQIVAYLDSSKTPSADDSKIFKLLLDILSFAPKNQSSDDMHEIYGAELINAFIAMNNLAKNKVDFN